MTTILAAAAAAFTIGYVAGRTAPGPRLLSWAEGHARGGWRNPANWAAQAIFAVALAFMWTVHPRRSLANVRSWREAARREAEPAPPLRMRRIAPDPKEPTP
ncbi:hypothetical protein [Streptomyces sp. NPDC047981]|uniref:hypothetical protein n=1 Tax=Streptomyces sp. NPDC047981 TaxID=3154610 RepID=UPI0034345A29